MVWQRARGNERYRFVLIFPVHSPSVRQWRNGLVKDAFGCSARTCLCFKEGISLQFLTHFDCFVLYFFMFFLLNGFFPA